MSDPNEWKWMTWYGSTFWDPREPMTQETLLSLVRLVFENPVEPDKVGSLWWTLIGTPEDAESPRERELIEELLQIRSDFDVHAGAAVSFPRGVEFGMLLYELVQIGERQAFKLEKQIAKQSSVAGRIIRETRERTESITANEAAQLCAAPEYKPDSLRRLEWFKARVAAANQRIKERKLEFP